MRQSYILTFSPQDLKTSNSWEFLMALSFGLNEKTKILLSVQVHRSHIWNITYSLYATSPQVLFFLK